MASEQNSRRKLVLPNKLTRRQIWLLTNEAGYIVLNENEDTIEFSRPADYVRRKVRLRELDEMQKASLSRRLNAIVDIYLDPYTFRDDIITRIRNLTRTMTTLESDFCWEWVEKNIDSMGLV